MEERELQSCLGCLNFKMTRNYKYFIIYHEFLPALSTTAPSENNWHQKSIFQMTLLDKNHFLAQTGGFHLRSKTLFSFSSNITKLCTKINNINCSCFKLIEDKLNRKNLRSRDIKIANLILFSLFWKFFLLFKSLFFILLFFPICHFCNFSHHFVLSLYFCNVFSKYVDHWQNTIKRDRT